MSEGRLDDSDDSEPTSEPTSGDSSSVLPRVKLFQTREKTSEVSNFMGLMTSFISLFPRAVLNPFHPDCKSFFSFIKNVPVYFSIFKTGNETSHLVLYK